MNKFEESKYALRLAQDNLNLAQYAYDKTLMAGGDCTSKGIELEEALEANKKAKEVWIKMRRA